MAASSCGTSRVEPALVGLAHARAPCCLAFSPDGSLLASGGLDATVRLWDAKLGTLLEEVPHPSPGLLAGLEPGWAPARQWRLRGHDSAVADAAESGPARCAQTLSGHSGWVRGLAFAPDGSRSGQRELG